MLGGTDLVVMARTGDVVAFVPHGEIAHVDVSLLRDHRVDWLELPAGGE